MERDVIDERREHYRQPTTLDVFVTPDDSSDTHLESRIINMSLLGCAIEPNNYSYKEKQCLSICFIQVKENCSQKTTIKAKVCHVCEDYIGLCFNSMGSDIMELLRELLKEAKYF